MTIQEFQSCLDLDFDSGQLAATRRLSHPAVLPMLCEDDLSGMDEWDPWGIVGGGGPS